MIFSLNNRDDTPSLLDICSQAGMSPLLLFLAGVFSVMCLFYVVRLFNKKAITICCGTWSPWNELVHITGALIMLFMVLPKPFALVYHAMTLVCLLVAFGYVLYLLTPKGPVRFWKLLHVHMYLSMTFMCVMMAGFPAGGMLVVAYGVVVNAIVLAYFAKAIKFCIEHKPTLWFALGSNISHVIMASTMILMFLFPETFMIGHAHHH